MELFNIEAEQCVLGSMMLEPIALMKSATFLQAHDFFEPIHQIIFKAILTTADPQYNSTLVGVSNYLKTKKQLDMIGGNMYLANLTDAIVTTLHLQQHLDIVKKYSNLRTLKNMGPEIDKLIEQNLGPDEILDTLSGKILGNLRQEREGFTHIKPILHDLFEELANKHDDHKKDYIPTGFKNLDKILLGFYPGDLVIIAARAAMGKTAFALNLAKQIAYTGKSVGFISLEMSAQQLALRLLSGTAKVNARKMLEARMEDSDWKNLGPAMDGLSQTKLFIDDIYVGTLREMKVKALQLKIEHGLDILFVDYLQLMTGTGKGNRVQEISEISRGLKLLARELQIPIVALAQLSREVEHRTDKRPQLSDLRDSGAIEQDADIVMMMYREDYYEPDTARKNMTDIFIRKHRNGGVGDAQLDFDKNTSSFQNHTL